MSEQQYRTIDKFDRMHGSLTGRSDVTRCKPSTIRRVTTVAWIDTFPITLPGGTVYHGEAHRSYAPSGWRIVVKDQPNGAVLFDSGKQHDMSHAQARFLAWLASNTTGGNHATAQNS